MNKNQIIKLLESHGVQPVSVVRHDRLILEDLCDWEVEIDNETIYVDENGFQIT